MNDKKYEILMDEKNTIEIEGHTLHRIRALKDFREARHWVAEKKYCFRQDITMLIEKWSDNI